MNTNVDFTTMTGPGLVHAYNEMVAEAAAKGLDGYRPVAKFADNKTGMKRCEALASGLRARKEGLNGAAKASEPEADAAQPEVPEVARTLIDAHVAEVERAGAEVTKLGTAAEPDSITSQTSLGALTTVELKGGKHEHEWETPPKKAKKEKKASEATARQGMRIVARVDKFPGKEATVGEKHFTEMVGRTVAEYEAACPKGKYGGTAPGQWLSYFVREGWVKLEG